MAPTPSLFCRGKVREGVNFPGRTGAFPTFPLRFWQPRRCSPAAAQHIVWGD